MKNLTALKHFVAILLLTFTATTATAYDLTFTKTDFHDNDPCCVYDFKSNTINFIEMQIVDNHQLKVTVWKKDLSSIEKEFALNIPQEYSLNCNSFYDAEDHIVTLGRTSGHVRSWDKDGIDIIFTRYLFTNSGLIEGVIEVCDDSDGHTYLFMDENSKLLGIYKSENSLGYLISPELTGNIIFEGGVRITSNNPGSATNTSGRGDVNSDGRVNVSDVSELVNIILGIIH